MKHRKKKTKKAKYSAAQFNALRKAGKRMNMLRMTTGQKRLAWPSEGW